MDAAVSAAGMAMGVGSLLTMAHDDPDSEYHCDAIEILIPGEKAALAATYWTPEGRERRAFVRAPMVSIIPPRQSHRIECQDPGCTLVLQLTADFFEQQVRAALGVPIAIRVARYATYDPFIREVGNTLQQDLSTGQAPNAAYLQPLAGVMAVHLARHYGSAAGVDPAPVGLPQHKLKRVQGFIDEHIAEAIHVERLAAEAHLSPFHFARMFKQATGQPPHLYVVMQRVERAKALLRDSELALIEIAARAGFRTQGHFTGVFRRYTGYTPRAFRLDCRAAQVS